MKCPTLRQLNLQIFGLLPLVLYHIKLSQINQNFMSPKFQIKRERLRIMASLWAFISLCFFFFHLYSLICGNDFHQLYAMLPHTR